eukprot:3128951-Rhodomonas_salina.1
MMRLATGESVASTCSCRYPHRPTEELLLIGVALEALEVAHRLRKVSLRPPRCRGTKLGRQGIYARSGGYLVAQLAVGVVDPRDAATHSGAAQYSLVVSACNTRSRRVRALARDIALRSMTSIFAFDLCFRYATPRFASALRFRSVISRSRLDFALRFRGFARAPEVLADLADDHAAPARHVLEP